MMPDQITPDVALKHEVVEASQFPEEANLHLLYELMDLILPQLPQSLQLQVAGDVILVLSGIVADRSTVLLEAWERIRNASLPFLYPELVESMGGRKGVRFDYDAIGRATLEPGQGKYQRIRPKKTKLKPDDSVVAEVSKEALLEFLDQVEAVQTKEEALHVAHDEDVSAWSSAISERINQEASKRLSLTQLAQELCRPWIEVWLGALLGGFFLERWGEDFYAGEIWVSVEKSGRV